LTDNLKEKYPFLKKDYAFTVCRIEPENNIEMILEAFKKNHKLVLIIVGNWNNSEYGINLKNKYHIYKNIHLMNPIYEQSILNQIRSNCKIYIHGHSAGGTNPSLVEAMYLGLAIFSYNIKYNQETTQYKALYFDSSKDLVKLLKDIDEKELYTIATNMERLAKDNYAWEQISKQYSSLFKEKVTKKAFFIVGNGIKLGFLLNRGAQIEGVSRYLKNPRNFKKIFNLLI